MYYLYTAGVKLKDLNLFLRNITPAPVLCVQAITASDISCCAKALLYTDSEMIVTPIIDNPKVYGPVMLLAVLGLTVLVLQFSSPGYTTLTIVVMFVLFVLLFCFVILVDDFLKYLCCFLAPVAKFVHI